MEMDYDKMIAELTGEESNDATFFFKPTSSDDLQRAQQKARDLSRIEAKDLRETARIENAVTAYNEAILAEPTTSTNSLTCRQTDSTLLSPLSVCNF
jgi:hypothetical protein